MASSCWRCPRRHRAVGLDDRAGPLWRGDGVWKVEGGGGDGDDGKRGGGCYAEVGGWMGEDAGVVRIALLDLIYLVHISYYTLKAHRINLQVSPMSSS
jgi:hypothetical protein